MSEEATAPVVAPPPGHPRFPLVDSLRAIAALSVLVYHTGYATSAIRQPVYGAFIERLNVGVTLFFVISGFLLYRPFVAARLLGAPSARLRDYARRRLLRILPAYWLALTVLAIYPGLSGVFTNHWWIYYGFMQIYNDGTVLKGIGPAWTLCIEITFYAALPVYAALVARGVRGRSRHAQVRIELGVLAAITAAVIGYRTWLHYHDFISPWFNTLFCYADWFAAGMALAVLSVASQGSDRRPAVLRFVERWPLAPWLVAAVAFWIMSTEIGGPHLINFFGHFGLFYSLREDLGIHCLATVVGVGLLIPAVFGAGSSAAVPGRGWIRRILADRRLAWLGLISYGIYLWQGPIKTVVCQPGGQVFVTDSCALHGVALFQHVPFLSLTVITLMVVVACAAASYYIVERPLLRLKDRRTPPAAPPPPAPRPPAPVVATAER
jgi:peptidoglycan/LPS O-acetylase OafA/YrhL